MSASDTERPRFAYLLLTHKNPRHVENLARRIQDLSPAAVIVVHHDASAAELPWDGRPPGGVHLIERIPVGWGDWSMVEATVRLLRHAVEGLEADWCVLLSGEHRPAADLSRWEAETASSGVDALLTAEQLPGRLHFGTVDHERNMLLARTLHRWRLFERPRSDLLHRTVGLFLKMSTWVRPIVSVEYVHRRESWAIGLRRRAGPVRNWSVYRGSQWFALSRAAVLELLAVDPSVVTWFSRSWIPDEAFLQTALRRVAGLVVADVPTTFVLDTPPVPYPGWMQLSSEDLPAAWASGLPFVRKVDLIRRPEVVTAIDRAADQRRGEASTRSGREVPGAATHA